MSPREHGRGASRCSPNTGDQLVQQIRSAAATATIEVQTVRGVSVLMGSGRNIAVLPGRDGKLLVDAGIPGSGQRIVEALAAISGDSITRLVNTHRHFDHTDGNEWLHAAGAAILAHENTRNHLSTTTRVGRLELHVPTVPRGRAPNGGLQDAAHSASQRHAVVLEHYEPAHTDSDVSVHFTDLDVIHLGDTWWNGVYPFIDYSTGGSIDGTIRAGLMHTLRER